MNSSSASNEDEIFEAASEIRDPIARDEFLARACSGNPQLRASLDELLKYHESSDDLLDASPIQSMLQPIDSPTPLIDGYTIHQRIGEGGFGIVYRAAQLNPLRREVALKVLKPGMDTEQVLQRFHAERQVLATMNHPNIAAVYDAGTTSQRRPYFAMELVDGEPIDAFCDSHGVPIPERIKLIVDVCNAVQHAHQKGVIHRDIKPSNVLVSLKDEKTLIKVIDFGIAKVLSTQSAMLTGQHQILGTPEYMSPEQVTQGSDVDTRSDIFSIGVLLFRLLTGKVPLGASGEIPEDMVHAYRLIREQEPPRPSSCVQDLDSATRQKEARQRQLRVTSFASTLRGDLDWIVLKALQKEPSARYQNTTELARDIERYLRAEPVSAGPPSSWYRARKFVRRNRIATVATCLVLCSIVVGGTFSAIGFHRARQQEVLATAGWLNADRQRHLAELERDKANEITRILQTLVGASHADRGHPIDYTVRELLDDFADKIGDHLDGQPEVEEIVRRTLGRSYWSFSDITRAQEQLTRVLELRMQRLGANDALTAQSRIDMAMCFLKASNLREAHKAVRTAMPVLEQAGLDEELAWAHRLLGAIHQEYGENDIAVEHLTKSCEFARESLGETHPVTLSMRLHRVGAWLASGDLDNADRETAAVVEVLQRREELLATAAHANRMRAMVLRQLAESASDETSRDTFAEAETRVQAALAADRRIFGLNHENVVRDLLVLSQIQRQTDRRTEAEQAAREAIEIAEHVPVEQEILRANSYQNLATLLETRPARGNNLGSQTKPQGSEAVATWEKVVAAKRELLGNHPEVARLLVQQAANVRRLNKPAEAVNLYREALEILETSTAEPVARQFPSRRNKDPQDVFFATVALDFVETAIESGDIALAEAVLERVLSRAEKEDLAQTRIAGRIIQASLHLARREVDEAEDQMAGVLATLENTRSMMHFRATLVSIDIRIEQAAFIDAEAKLYEFRRRMIKPHANPFIVDAIGRRFVHLYTAWGRPVKARQWMRRISD